MKSALIVFIVSIFFIVHVPVSVFAAEDATASSEAEQKITIEPINLTLSPVSVQFETDPGKNTTAEIKIRNNGTVTEYLTLSHTPFTADASGERPLLRDALPEDEYLQWLTYQTDTIVIEPGEWKTITLNFNPPESASLAYYYSLMVNRETIVKAKPGETVISGSPAILVLATVNSPNAKRELQVTNFSVGKKILEFLPQTFSIKIKNTGNVHVMPTGNIFIDGQGDKDIGILSVNEKLSVVLPNSERTFSTDWKDGFPIIKESKESTATEKEYELEWDFSKADKLRFGKYTAHLLLVYDNGERDVPIESFISFWVIPWKILLASLVVLVLVLIGIRSTLRPIFKMLRHKEHRNDQSKVAS